MRHESTALFKEITAEQVITIALRVQFTKLYLNY
jgi:hypothetical protein